METGYHGGASTADKRSRGSINFTSAELSNVSPPYRPQKTASHPLTGFSQSASEIQQLLESHSGALGEIFANTQQLRKDYPHNTVPESVLGSQKTAASVFGKDGSILGETEFTFDDLVVNSKAYRRVMTLAQVHSARVGKEIEQTIDVANANAMMPMDALEVRRSSSHYNDHEVASIPRPADLEIKPPMVSQAHYGDVVIVNKSTPKPGDILRAIRMYRFSIL
jgi:hypothetical protein